MSQKTLKIEVLVNSPGPHDAVRIREPFLEMQKMGVDCRIHERPFRFNDCIRPYSLVLWQRPMPRSWRAHMEHLQWLRERGCLLLTEWDDHPELFNEKIKKAMKNAEMAQLVGCHAVHTSNATLSNVMKEWNPLVFVLENSVANIKNINLKKHDNKITTIFIGNQNRKDEHQGLVEPLIEWGNEDSKVRIIVIGDQKLANSLNERISCESYNTLSYEKYREVLSKCHIALLPLKIGIPQRCKTVIKWAEASAESVAVVAGPELYKNIEFDRKRNRTATIANDGIEMIKKAKELAVKKTKRTRQIEDAYNWVKTDWNLKTFVIERRKLYEEIWKKRVEIDNHLAKRLNDKVSLLKQHKIKR